MTFEKQSLSKIMFRFAFEKILTDLNKIFYRHRINIDSDFCDIFACLHKIFAARHTCWRCWRCRWSRCCPRWRCRSRLARGRSEGARWRRPDKICIIWGPACTSPSPPPLSINRVLLLLLTLFSRSYFYKTKFSAIMKRLHNIWCCTDQGTSKWSCYLQLEQDKNGWFCFERAQPGK